MGSDLTTPAVVIWRNGFAVRGIEPPPGLETLTVAR
jgi:hypothetical protein